MASTYEIFKKDTNGIPVWVEAAPNLEAARLRVTDLNKQRSGEYMIFCHVTQEMVSGVPAQTTETRLFIKPDGQSSDRTS
jgi:hypothetical protein